MGDGIECGRMGPTATLSCEGDIGMKRGILSRARRFVYHELLREHAYLLVLRVFMGIGWIRTCLEKLAEAGWWDGTAVSIFLKGQMITGEVVFPFYQELITNVFLPNALVLGFIIMFGEGLIGLSLLTGTFTNFGLLNGMLLNLNLIGAGATDPSAFYLIIQSVLFISNTGAILGVDMLLSKKIPFALLVAQPQFELKYLWVEKVSFLGLIFVSGLIASYATFYVQDWSPSSVKDPAMIIVVLATFGALSSFITFLRLQWIGWGRPMVWGRGISG